MAKIHTVWLDGKRGLKPAAKLRSGFIVGYDEQKNLVLAMVGEPDFEETVEQIMNFMLSTMEIADDITRGKKKDEIYDHVVSTFSLYVDKFHPEAKEHKYEFGDKTDKELLDEHEEKISNAADKQGKTKVS
jgi:hypothetical protein